MSSFLPAADESATSTPKELIPTGTHEAYCYGCVDLGTQERKPYMGKEKSPARKIMLYFEFPDIRSRFKEDGPEEPRVKSQSFTYFTSENSALTALCKAWLGKNVKDVDFGTLAGTPASITIAHEPAKADPTKIYDNMVSITALSPKLVPLMTPQYNENMNFSILQDGFDSPKFEKLYDWVKKIIMESAEYKEYLSGPKMPNDENPFGA